MIDLSEIHKQANCDMSLSRFFKLKAYTDTVDYLRRHGVPQNKISYFQRPYRGSQTIAYAHPIIAIEFLRWVNYDKYLDWVGKTVRLPTEV
jgi:hypothetical protein